MERWRKTTFLKSKTRISIPPTRFLPPIYNPHLSKIIYQTQYTLEKAASFQPQLSDAMQDPVINDAVVINEYSNQESNDDTNLRDHNDELQQECTSMLIEKHWPKFNTQRTDQDLVLQEQATAAAGRQMTEFQTTYFEGMSAAGAKIPQLPASTTSTFNNRWEANELREQLFKAKKEKATELAAKNKEIEILQNCNDERGSEISRLRVKNDHDRLANRETARKCLDRAKLAADRDAKTLKEENKNLESKREKAESRASDAEGRAQGLQDQLRATQRRADNWEALHSKTEEDARNQILSAYEVTPVQLPEEDQQTTTKSSQEKELYIHIEELQKENGDLKEKTDLLTAEVMGWRRAWDDAVKAHQSWEEEIHRWQEVTRRLYDQEKQEALAAERTNGQVLNGRDTTEHDIRRRCEEGKQKALAMERENCRLQRMSEKCSLRGQRELKKLRRCERKMQTKAKKCQLKWVFKRAVSHAVDVERSLLQTQFQTQIQTELSNYKTQIESEHAKSQSQSETHNNTAPIDKVLLDQEIKKRNEFIETQKDHLGKAFEAKREAESAKKESEKELKIVREENERLSRDVIDYKSQQVMASQTKNEAQITLITQELVRALKLFTEIALLGLDEKHRNLLNELVVANTVMRDIRVTIEEGSVVDYEEFQNRVDRVFATSDGFDSLHPQERPALHAQLQDTYSVIGGLNNILAGKRGDTTNQEILERVYRDIVKGKEKQGAIVGSGAAAGPSCGVGGGMNGAPLPQFHGSKSLTSDPNDAHPPEANNEWNQGTFDSFDPDSFDPESFDLNSVDWSHPAWLDIKI